MISISHIPCYYRNNCPGSQSETWQQETPWIAVCLKDLCTKYDTRRALHVKSYKHMSLLPWLQHFNIDK